MTRNKVLGKAVDDCLKDLYSFVQPHIEWDDFIEENKIYTNLYKEWELYIKSKIENKKLYDEYNKKFDWEGKSITECIGPRPYEFYYLPKEIMKSICDSYIYAYRINQQQELLDTIQILKNYCKEPIVDKYIEGENGFPGHRGYEHPDNLEKEIYKYLDSNFTGAEFRNAEVLKDKFFEFLDMAGKFYSWNSELNSFNSSVYLGPSPNSNKEAVINNWKKYRNQDIEIDEEQIKKDYYGEGELD